MSPAYLNPPPSPFPFVDQPKDDHQHIQFFTSSSVPNQASSSLSSPIFFNISQEYDQRGSQYPREPQQDQQKAENYILQGGSSAHQAFPSFSFQSTVVDTNNNGHKLSYYKFDDHQDEDKRDGSARAAKWMSSKMRLMQKMMSSDCSIRSNKQVRIGEKFHDHDQYQNNGETTDSPSDDNKYNFIRVCADCNTTKTPLWRSGPRGPKSLCNACGIRQRKARRAMAAATGATNGTVVATDTSSTAKAKLQNKEKKSAGTSYIEQYKKPFKPPTGPPAQSRKKKSNSFEDFAMSLISKNSTFRRVFPKDEEEAAILLMALSCGLIHS